MFRCPAAGFCTRATKRSAGTGTGNRAFDLLLERGSPLGGAVIRENRGQVRRAVAAVRGPVLARPPRRRSRRAARILRPVRGAATRSRREGDVGIERVRSTRRARSPHPRRTPRARRSTRPRRARASRPTPATPTAPRGPPRKRRPSSSPPADPKNPRNRGSASSSNRRASKSSRREAESIPTRRNQTPAPARGRFLRFLRLFLRFLRFLRAAVRSERGRAGLALLRTVVSRGAPPAGRVRARRGSRRRRAGEADGGHRRGVRAPPRVGARAARADSAAEVLGEEPRIERRRALHPAPRLDVAPHRRAPGRRARAPGGPEPRAMADAGENKSGSAFAPSTGGFSDAGGCVSDSPRGFVSDPRPPRGFSSRMGASDASPTRLVIGSAPPSGSSFATVPSDPEIPPFGFPFGFAPTASVPPIPEGMPPLPSDSGFPRLVRNPASSAGTRASRATLHSALASPAARADAAAAASAAANPGVAASAAASRRRAASRGGGGERGRRGGARGRPEGRLERGAVLGSVLARVLLEIGEKAARGGGGCASVGRG